MGLGLDAILPGLGAVTSIVGAFGANARAKDAAAARERALSEYAGQLDRDYQDTVTGNLTALRRTAGNLGDALHGYSTDVGDQSAAAGVYNSSAVAGAIARQGQNNAAALGQMGAENFQNEQSLLNSNRRDLEGQRMGIANQNYQQAIADRNSAYSGLSNSLGGLSAYYQQRQLASSRQNQQDSFMSSLQQAIQPDTGQSAGVQSISSRNNGIMMNGNQGSGLYGGGSVNGSGNLGGFQPQGRGSSLYGGFPQLTPGRRLF